MQLWGWFGGALSAAQLLPQIWRIYLLKSGTQISRWSVTLRLVSYGLYLVHARIIDDSPLFWMTLAGLVLLFLIACQILWYDYSSVSRNVSNSTLSVCEENSSSGISGEKSASRASQSTDQSASSSE